MNPARLWSVGSFGHGRTRATHTHRIRCFVCLISLLHTSKALFWMLTTVRALHTFETITTNTFASLSAGAWTCAHCLFSKPSRRERNKGKVARFCSLTRFGGTTPRGLHIIKTISYITIIRKKSLFSHLKQWKMTRVVQYASCKLAHRLTANDPAWIWTGYC